MTTLQKYLAERRKMIEERIAAEVLAGNDFKRDCERAALAELAGVEYVIRNESYYKISTDGVNNTLESHGMSSAVALICMLQHLMLETINVSSKAKGVSNEKS